MFMGMELMISTILIMVSLQGMRDGEKTQNQHITGQIHLMRDQKKVLLTLRWSKQLFQIILISSTVQRILNSLVSQESIDHLSQELSTMLMVMELKTTWNWLLSNLMSSTNLTCLELKSSTFTIPDMETCQEKETNGSIISNLNQLIHTILLKKNGIDSVTKYEFKIKIH